MAQEKAQYGGCAFSLGLHRFIFPLFFSIYCLNPMIFSRLVSCEYGKNYNLFYVLNEEYDVEKQVDSDPKIKGKIHPL